MPCLLPCVLSLLCCSNHVYSDSRIFSEFGIPVECLNRTCHVRCSQKISYQIAFSLFVVFVCDPTGRGAAVCVPEHRAEPERNFHAG